MPNENNGQTRWKTDAAEFRGYMRASVEAIKKDTKDLKEKTECIPLLKSDNAVIKADVKSLHKKVGNLRLKVAGISGTIALIVTIIVLLLKAEIF